MFSDFFRSILDWVFNIIGNYGWSVIAFSILIKCVLLPLDVKSRKSMRAMQKLQPQLDKLKKKYGSDQEKMNQKTQELYKKNKVNPLAGCLPLLIQMPILFAMFGAMRSAAAEMQLTQMGEWIRANLMTADGAFLSAEDVTSALESGAITITNTSAESWLWIKSVYQPDSFMKAFIPTVSELSAQLSGNKDVLSAENFELLTQYVQEGNAVAAAVDAFITKDARYVEILNMLIFTVKWPRSWTYVNGALILPFLAGATQFLQSKLQPTGTENSGGNAGTGNFMKWFFPIFSIWICLSSTAAFAIYWVFVNVWGIFTTFIINKYLEMKDNKNPVATEEAINP